MDPATIERGLELGRNCLRLAPRNEWSHWHMGVAFALAGQLDAAVRECERSLELNPNFLLGHGSVADILPCSAALRRRWKPAAGFATGPRNPTNFGRHASMPWRTS